MRILVISNSEWDDGNSFGNTFSNFLSFESASNIANIYCRNGTPSSLSCSYFLSMGESFIVKRLLRKGDFQELKNVLTKEIVVNSTIKQSCIKRFMRLHRWTVFFWAREMLWSLCPWKTSPVLHKFVEEFKPDILLLPTYSFSYINKLALHISDKYNLPVVSYISDDEYSLCQFSLSPLYWINRLYQRIWMKKVFDRSQILYTISDLQKEYFEGVVKCPCKVLTKGMDFSGNKPQTKQLNCPVKLFYAGNIGTGRWKSLKLIADAIGDLNQIERKFEFSIYTGTPITEKLKQAFHIDGVSLNGYVHSSKVSALIKSSDILVHAESFKKSDRMAVRQSFSTKIVDYLHSGKCILGIGPSDVASIDFLKRYDAAFVIEDKSNAKNVLELLINNPLEIEKLTDNAWSVGKKCCDIYNIHTMLKEDFESIINKNK